MTKDYGSNAPLSYNKYLRVADLIGLQDCLSDPQHHDELLFITIHQAYELWFKQILHEIDAAILMMNEDRLAAAGRTLRRVVEIEKLLVNQIHILETMSPISFLAFRDQLNPASGFQSMQFREIEFASGLKHQSMLDEFRIDQFAHDRLQKRFAAGSLGDAFYQSLRQRGLDAPGNEDTNDEQERLRRYGKRTQAVLEILTHFDEHHEEFQLAEALLEHDEYFSLWRSHHIKMVERMVGTKRGTGGSEGVGYLRTTLDKKFFPELWEARTYLDTQHGEAGCPFAKSEVKPDNIPIAEPGPEPEPEPQPEPAQPSKSSAPAIKTNRVSVSTERRQAPRAKVNLRVRWEGDLGRREAEVTSLSKSGCFVLSGGKVKAKELIRLDILLPHDEQIQVWAQVVDEADEIGFAVKFTLVDETDQERLDQFLEQNLSVES
ncbi:MAG TPA: tryptophan 2,3-dioxygenase family protein [Pyrinomonadaceae bacterium]|nr:tryptophan 2,3-dioxygenase family protein [Pyrinomonadaceae bacterium]